MSTAPAAAPVAPAPAPAPSAPASAPAPAAPAPAPAAPAPAPAAPAGDATLLAGSTEQTADPADKGEGGEATETVERAAPEKYEFKLPEGTQLDSEVLAKFEGIARELKMPQAEAQAVVETLAPVIQARVAQQLTEQMNRTSDEWSTAAKSDQEFGGAKLTENLAVAEKALAAFGTPGLSTLLKTSRLGNNPEVIRFMYRVGKGLSEDTIVTGRAALTKSAAETMYPSMAKKQG